MSILHQSMNIPNPWMEYGTINTIVCDPSPPQLGKLVLQGDESWSKEDKLIESEQAIKFALRGIREHKLRQDRTFNLAIRDAKPISPVLVQRLYLHDTYYYLMLFATNNGVTTMLSVDGLYGNFGGAIILSKGTTQPFIDRDKVYK